MRRSMSRASLSGSRSDLLSVAAGRGIAGLVRVGTARLAGRIGWSTCGLAVAVGCGLILGTAISGPAPLTP